MTKRHYRFRDDPSPKPGQWRLIEDDVVRGLMSLPDNYVRCTVTSQPYLGQRTYGVEGEYGRERTIEEHVERMGAVARELLRVTVSDGLLFWNLRDPFSAAPDRLSYSYEEILLFSKSERHWFDVDAVVSATGARLLDVWEFPAGRQPAVPVDGRIMRGTASFPQILPEICLNLGSEPGDVILDPFCGFGTTILAAVKWGRHAIGIDLNGRDLAATRSRMATAGYADLETTEPPAATNYRGLPLLGGLQS
jgi:hypothetical protein